MIRNHKGTTVSGYLLKFNYPGLEVSFYLAICYILFLNIRKRAYLRVKRIENNFEKSGLSFFDYKYQKTNYIVFSLKFYKNV